MHKRLSHSILLVALLGALLAQFVVFTFLDKPHPAFLLPSFGRVQPETSSWQSQQIELKVRFEDGKQTPIAPRELLARYPQLHATYVVRMLFLAQKAHEQVEADGSQQGGVYGRLKRFKNRVERSVLPDPKAVQQRRLNATATRDWLLEQLVWRYPDRQPTALFIERTATERSYATGELLGRRTLKSDTYPLTAPLP